MKEEKMDEDFAKKISKNIDDTIDNWHNGISKLELHEYLGMTWDEYSEWLIHRDSVNGNQKPK